MSACRFFGCSQPPMALRGVLFGAAAVFAALVVFLAATFKDRHKDCDVCHPPVEPSGEPPA